MYTPLSFQYVPLSSRKPISLVQRICETYIVFLESSEKSTLIILILPVTVIYKVLFDPFLVADRGVMNRRCDWLLKAIKENKTMECSF